MNILGINISGINSSACLVVDGQIKVAISEERLSKIKQDKNFPKKAIKYCCDYANISQKEIKNIYIGWNPKYYLNKSDNSLYESLMHRGKISYLALNELSVFNNEKIKKITQAIKTENTDWNINFINHHDAHLSNVIFNSGFDSADFLIADGYGEHTSGCIGQVTQNDIKKFDSFRAPHSLGSFYSTFTQYLGFRPYSDEWKVMALASLGNPDIYYEKVKNLIKVSDLSFELDLSYFEYYLSFTDNYFSPKFIKLFGEPINDLKSLNEDRYNLVAAVQKVVEEACLELINNLQKKTNSKKIVVSGGFFMNSVLNGKILSNSKYENIYIGGSPDDSGISIGAAQYGFFLDKKNKQKNTIMLKHNYFGKEYSDEDILREINKRKIKSSTINNVEAFVAKKLREKKIVGWFQGKSEFGQRALGNRSILADPTHNDIKDIINKSVKYREQFRPFAPAILKEKQEKYFNITKKQDSYFMEKVFMFKKEYIKKLPGVVHFDGSGRLQTVDKEINPKFYSLIEEFEKLSDHPVIINTSLNINGVPMAETPSDAIDCFFQSGIDFLVMNNIVISKKD